MPLTRFEECWPSSLRNLSLNSLKTLSKHSNPDPNPLANQLWCIDFLTPSLHLSSSPTDSLSSLNLLCHSKTDARFMLDDRKIFWSIPYVSCGIFQVYNRILLHIALLSVLMSRLHFEIHQLWQSGFSRLYSNCCL